MLPASSNILTINRGSSSIKFALYQAGALMQRKLTGKIDRISLYAPDRLPPNEEVDGVAIHDNLRKNSISFYASEPDKL
ncbi:MAG: hypothetical protein ACYCY1_05275 [Sulfuriferula sp.]